MLPAMGIPVLDGRTCNVPAVTVNGSIRLLNCSCTTAFVGTPLAPSSGLTVTTLGGVRAAPVPGVKVVVTGAASVLPPTSCAPATVTVDVVGSASGTTRPNV